MQRFVGMIGAIIWYVTMFGCGALFYGIGIYARRREEPMWFWSGSKVDSSTITDVVEYNRENARMWKVYSLWYWTSGILWVWSEHAALVVLLIGSTVGIGLLVHTYLKIEKKYKKTCL